MVEHNLAKVGVAGSNPVSRSIWFDCWGPKGWAEALLEVIVAAVAKWVKGGGLLQNLYSAVRIRSPPPLTGRRAQQKRSGVCWNWETRAAD